MIRGIAAAFKFTLPHELRHIADAKVVFWQDGYNGTATNPLPIVKQYTNANFVGVTSKDLIVVLSASETKAFTDKLKARVQMRAFSEQYEDANGQIIQQSYLGTVPQLFTVYPMNDGFVDGAVDENTPTQGEYVILDGGDIVVKKVE